MIRRRSVCVGEGISWPEGILGVMGVMGRCDKVDWECRAGDVWARSEGPFQPTPCCPLPRALLGAGTPSLRPVVWPRLGSPTLGGVVQVKGRVSSGEGDNWLLHTHGRPAVGGKGTPNSLLKSPIPLGKQQDGVLGLGLERSLLETRYLT